jgi:hypothetical protein
MYKDLLIFKKNLSQPSGSHSQLIQSPHHHHFPPSKECFSSLILKKLMRIEEEEGDDDKFRNNCALRLYCVCYSNYRLPVYVNIVDVVSMGLSTSSLPITPISFHKMLFLNRKTLFQLVQKYLKKYFIQSSIFQL